MYMPVVKIFIRLALEQKFLFLDGHYNSRDRPKTNYSAV